MKRWAMNLPETFAELSSANRGNPSTADTYAAYFREKRSFLLNEAKEYYSELN